MRPPLPRPAPAAPSPPRAPRTAPAAAPPAAPPGIPPRLWHSHGDSERGRAWLASLPARRAEVVAAWGLTLDEPFAPGGWQGWVAPGRTEDGQAVVLKLTPPWLPALPARAMARDGGRTLPRLLAHRAGAALMERVSGTPLAHLPRSEQQALLPALLATLATLPSLGGAPRRAAAVDSEVSLIGRVALTDPWLAEVQAHWLALAPPADAEVALHGDLHAEQILVAEGGRIRLLDPEPALGPREWDLEPLLRAALDAGDTAALGAALATFERSGVARSSLLWQALLRGQHYYALLATHPVGDEAALVRWRRRLATLIALPR